MTADSIVYLISDSIISVGWQRPEFHLPVMLQIPTFLIKEKKNLLSTFRSWVMNWATIQIAQQICVNLKPMKYWTILYKGLTFASVFRRFFYGQSLRALCHYCRLSSYMASRKGYFRRILRGKRFTSFWKTLRVILKLYLKIIEK